MPKSDDGMNITSSFLVYGTLPNNEAASIVDRNCESLISGAVLCNQQVTAREDKDIVQTHEI